MGDLGPVERRRRSELGSVERSTLALRRQFPHIDNEAISLFIGDSLDVPDADAIVALCDMQAEAQRAARYGDSGFLPVRGCTVTRQVGSESCAGASEVQVSLRFEGGNDPSRVGTVLIIEGLQACRLEAVAVATPDGRVLNLEVHGATTYFLLSDYGMHELRMVLAEDGTVATCPFMVTSQLGDFSEALDQFHDTCDWLWDGNWTEELEEAIMTMLSALDDYFTLQEATLQRSAMGSTLMSEIGPARRRLETSLAKALEEHDAQSVGHIYGGIRSFLQSQGMFDMFGPMLGGGSLGNLQESPLYQSVRAFERERFATASEGKKAEVKDALKRLIDTADAYAAEVGPANDFTGRWHGGIRAVIAEMWEDPKAVIHPLPFQQLRGGASGQMMEMMKGFMDSMGCGGRGGGTVQRSNTLEACSMLKPDASIEEADAKVSRWDESLVDETVLVGGPMNPFELHGREPWVQTVMATITNVLSLGLAYVSQGSDDAPSSKMIALLGRDRAALPLHSHDEFLQDRRRRDRLKDVCRIVRAVKKKRQWLSLSVSTDFKGALSALKKHHSDNWIGSSLEAVWNKMSEVKLIFAFELWLHEEDTSAEGAEAKQPRLIAADFGHPHTNGLAYYVTTRFFDREFRTLQPGFILAFAEAECLRRAGFELWDLGGGNKSPMMSYKPQVAIEMGRSSYLRRLRECRVRAVREMDGDAPSLAECERRRLPLTDANASLPACGDKVPTGVVFADVTDETLWGAFALQAQEERLRAAQEAAKKAAKKVQKPSKASKKSARAAKQEGVPDAAAQSAPVVDAKAAAQRRFMTVFQELLAKGVSRNEAAAQALQIAACT